MLYCCLFFGAAGSSAAARDQDESRIEREGRDGLEHPDSSPRGRISVVALRGDDRLHVLGGAATALLAASLAWEFTAPEDIFTRAGILLAAGAGSAVFFALLKEMLDALGFGAVEARDIGYTVSGGVVGAAAAGALVLVAQAAGLAPPVGAVVSAVAGLVLGYPVGKAFLKVALRRLLPAAGE